jgi:hypothetical protein
MQAVELHYRQKVKGKSSKQPRFETAESGYFDKETDLCLFWELKSGHSNGYTPLDYAYR